MKKLPLRVLGAAALALMCVPALLHSAAKPKIELALDPYELTLRNYCFPSGLRVLFQEDHSQPVVSLTMVIDKGSADDPVGQEGLAHLIEHLWFRSSHGNTPMVWDLLHEMGANLNAFTSSDVTAYMTVAPKEMLPALLRLEALRLSEPLAAVTDTEVSLEREIVRNELRMRYENSGTALQYIRERLFPTGHPYARLGIGTHESLNGLTLDMAHAFVGAHYRPENATLMVVGDLKLDETAALLDKTFSRDLLVDPKDPEAALKLVQCPVRITGPSEAPPPPVDRTLAHFKGGVEKPTLVLAWSMPGGYRADTTLLQMTAATLNSAVGRSINRWTDPKDSERRNSFGCGLIAEEHASTALCEIELGDGQDPEVVRQQVEDSLFRMWDADEREFQQMAFSRARYSLMANLFRSVEVVASLGGRGTSSAQFIHFTGDASYFSRNFEWLANLDPFEIPNIASTYLNRERMVAVVIDPFEKGERDLNAPEGIYQGRPREPVVNSVVDLEKMGPGYIKRLVKPPPLESIRDFTLSNGLQVILLPYGEAPFARVMMMFRGGRLVEPQPGLDRYAWDMTETPGWLGEEPFRIAGQWVGYQGPNHQYLGLSGSSANLDDQLWLMRQDLDGLTAKIRDSERYVEGAIKALHQQRKEPDGWVGYVTQQRLFPGHPLSSRPEEADFEALGDLSNKDIAAWNRRIFQPANAVLIVVGRFDADQAQALVAERLETWTVKKADGQRMPDPPGPPEPPARQIIVFDKENVTQTQVGFTCQISPADANNGEAQDVLGEVLNELAWVALRETSGVTYGAGASTQYFPGGTAMLRMSSSVQNDAAALAVGTFFDLSGKVSRGEVDPRLVTLMKAQLARGYVLNQQTTGQMQSRILDPIRDGYGWENLMPHGARLAAVQVEDLTQQMERCTGHEVVTLLGPKEVITPQLDKAGLTYEVFDWQAEADRRWEAWDAKSFAKEKERRDKKDAEAGEKTEPEAPAAPPSLLDDVLTSDRRSAP